MGLKFNKNKYSNSYDNRPIKVKTVDKRTPVIIKYNIKNTLTIENRIFLHKITAAIDKLYKHYGQVVFERE